MTSMGLTPEKDSGLSSREFIQDGVKFLPEAGDLNDQLECYHNEAKILAWRLYFN